jgi:hypothetical protein
MMWSIFLFLCQICDRIAALVGEAFVRVLNCNHLAPPSPPPSLVNSCTQNQFATLLLPLPDSIVRRELWSRLNSLPSPSLLWRLRRVKRSWSAFVATMVEWQALEIVRQDHFSYITSMIVRKRERASLTERLKTEVSCVRFLLSEDLSVFAKYIPPGCSHDEANDPKYYEVLYEEDMTMR